MLLAAQTHVGSKNLQVHMEPYLWKTRADGVNIINIGKTWYVLQLALGKKQGGASWLPRRKMSCYVRFTWKCSAARIFA